MSRIVNALQDQLLLDAPGDTPFVCPDYDATSFDGVRNALLQLARFSGGAAFANAFGSRDSVDPVMHLIGTAAGWGGLPPSEAMYLSFEPDGPLGEYKIEFGEVPVGAFWSVSLYNRAGYFERMRAVCTASTASPLNATPMAPQRSTSACRMPTNRTTSR
ncbi:MAG: hypothetical protein R2843_07660 [Thermomicrobiales bacterium]